MKSDTKYIALAIVVAAIIISLPLWFIHNNITLIQECYPCNPDKSLTKEFRWMGPQGPDGMVVGSQGDSLTVWLEQNGQEVEGTRKTLTTGPWTVTWNDLEPETYDIVFSYRHHSADPDEGEGRESVELNCHPKVVNILVKEEPKGLLGFLHSIFN